MAELISVEQALCRCQWSTIKTKILKFFAAIFSIFVLCACSPYPSNINEFKVVVASWRLEQLSTKEASAFLTSKGFKVNQHEAEKRLPGQGGYIYATHSYVTNMVCITDWKVTLLLAHEEISEVRSSVSYTCS